MCSLALTCSLALACDSGKKEEDEATKAAAAAKAANAKAEAKLAEAEAKAQGAPAEATPAEAPPEAEAKAAPAPARKGYGGEFCATIIPCFQQLKFAGSFSADVSVDIEPDGSVSAVSFTGDAPKPVQKCITDAIEAIKLTSYSGKPGRARCTKSGQLMGGTQMIMSDFTYEEREAGAADAAPAGEAEASEAEAKA
ncbi:MAG: hypothetical protein KDK70_42155, partial [Myxococcales bacterium]|nr:hypothetical protein [Myxococcales bacterium]